MGLKGKSREKARPKKGKMEIDYQKLHDAFFVYAIPPATPVLQHLSTIITAKQPWISRGKIITLMTQPGACGMALSPNRFQDSVINE
jgi:hypothetical protein